MASFYYMPYLYRKKRMCIIEGEIKQSVCHEAEIEDEIEGGKFFMVQDYMIALI